MLKRREGFTLIELLIVVVIIGILAAIAIPKFSATREKAYLASMQSDLRNLATAQEIYYSDDNDGNGSADYVYASATTFIADFSESNGVSVAIGGGDGSGWNATATHAGLGASIGCAVYYGTGAQATASTPGGTTASAPGTIICDPT